MEAAFRAVGRVFNRHFPNTILKQSSTITVKVNTTTTTTYRSFPRTNPPPSSTSPIAFFHSHSYSHLGNPIPNGLSCQSNRRMDGLFGWHLAPETGRKDTETTVVLLGWLDGKQKHLRRYVEWYNSQGIHAITFVVEVGELLGSDSRERIERRINALANDITSWVTDDDDGQDRRLLFHTFSNTGFLTYAYLIEILLGKAGVTDKVRGCVVDSGGAGLFNHKIWAAGFAAAILKQTSSTTQPDDTKSLVQGVLEKSFAVVLKSPQVYRKLRKMVGAMSKKQLSYPRLYLYSTRDSIVPHEAIKAVIIQEKGKGRKVQSHDFGSSPHVDHYRNFPETYISLLRQFLKECFSTAEPVIISSH